MNFEEVLEKRQSIRGFLEKDVPEKLVQEILEAIKGAPSAGNLQAFEVVLIKDKARKKELADSSIYGQKWIADARIILAFFANPKKSSERYKVRGKKLYCIQDATIACTIAWLKAVSLGLSACWVGAFEDEKVSKALNAPKELIPVALLPIGYAKIKGENRPRKELKDLVKKERF